MKTFGLVGLGLVLFGSAVIAQQSNTTKEPQELVRLRAQCDAQVFEKARPVLQDYAAALQQLEDRLAKSKQLEEAVLVKRERESVQNRIKEGSGTKLGLLTQPQRYADEHLGRAGGQNNNNVYVLNVKRLGHQSTARLYIHGLDGTDTSGDVLLKQPDGTESTIFAWDPKAMAEKPARSTSYKDVQPVEVDVSQFLTQPGKYEVTFRFVSGAFGLSIRKVEIETRDR